MSNTLGIGKEHLNSDEGGRKMSKTLGMRWLVVVAGAAMLLALAAACGETKTVEVPGETVVVKEAVIKEVQVPGETVVVEKEVVKEVEVPGETVVVEKEVVKEVMVPGKTVVVEKEVLKVVEVRQGYVTDPTTGKTVTAPQYGGTITSGWQSTPPGSTDVYTVWNVWPHITGFIEKLAMADWGIDRDEYDIKSYSFPIPSWATRGALAESWTIPDDTTFVFNIRKGVNWQDKAPMNGRELDAYDIEWNFHRALGLGSGFTEVSPTQARFGAHKWESVTATDKWTVVFKMTEPALWAESDLFWGENNGWIYPPEVFEQYGDFDDWRNLVGTGPFMLTDVIEGSSATLTKNPDYWGYDEKYPENRLPYIDELRGLVMLDEATRMAALRTGKIDSMGTHGFTLIDKPDTSDSLARTNPEIVQHQFVLRSDNALAVNVTKPPLDDIRVRQALQMAIDHDEINDIFFKGLVDWEPKGPALVQGYTVPFDEWPEEVKKGYTYDPAGAEALLDAAGLPRGADGIRVKLWVPILPSNDFTYAETVVAYWREIGVELEMRSIASAEFMPTLIEREYDVLFSQAAAGLFGGGGAAWEITKFSVQKDIGDFGAHWMWNAGPNDPDYNQLIEVTNAATSFEEYGRLLGEADMYVVKKHWLLWGVGGPKTVVVQPWVAGFNGELLMGRQDPGPVFARLWIDQELKEAMGH